MAGAFEVKLCRGWSAALACAVVLCACQPDPVLAPTGGSSSRGPNGTPTALGAAGSSADVVGKGGARAVTPPASQLMDGARCDSDDECASGHCNNDICCESGDCCEVAADCPASDDNTTAVCDEPESCQGSRGAAMCVKNRCRARDPVDDDSACDAMVESGDCGPYKPVFCDGKKDQRQPSCKTSCSTDDDCDDEAHCENGACVTNVPDGGACMDEGDCESGHCDKGVCCEEGDCCKTAMDCDTTKYSSPAVCDDEAMCQGTHGVPACEAGQCTIAMADDDSACDGSVVANDCGDGPDVKCRGGADQKAPPACAGGTCGLFSGGTCGQDAFCYQGMCLPDQPNGARCPDGAACQSGHCQNNICCEEGDCCVDDTQCPAIRVCTDGSNCQGTRTDRRCNQAKGVCENTAPMPVDDDSACFGRVAGTDCGLNLPVLCSAAREQSQPPKTACPRCTGTPTCGMGETLTLLGSCGTYNPETMMLESIHQPTSFNYDMPIGCRASQGVTCGPGGWCTAGGAAR